MKILKRAAVALAGAATLLAVASTSASAAPATPIKDTHWAGYMLIPNSTGTTTEWQQIHTRLTVPTLNCTQTPNSAVYHFAGIGGNGSLAGVNAAGIVEQCSSGTASYYGTDWYFYCKFPSCQELEGGVLAINPGDSISLTVTAILDQDGYSFTIADHTTGTRLRDFETVGAGPPSLGPAEIVSYGNIHRQGTADFGSATFTGSEVVPYNGPDANQHLAFNQPSLWHAQGLLLQGPVTKRIDIQPSLISGGGKVFTNTWERPN